HRPLRGGGAERGADGRADPRAAAGGGGPPRGDPPRGDDPHARGGDDRGHGQPGSPPRRPVARRGGRDLAPLRGGDRGRPRHLDPPDPLRAPPPLQLLRAGAGGESDGGSGTMLKDSTTGGAPMPIATVNFSVPEEVKQAFNETFAGENK